MANACAEMDDPPYLQKCDLYVIKLYFVSFWQVVSDEIQIFARVLPSYEGAQEARHHPLELVPEDAVDDEVDGAVDCHKEVVGLCERVVDLSNML